nr:hypothetical protein [Tanacetum cinerariifolium]
MKVNVYRTSVLRTVSLTGGSSSKNSTSLDTMPPLIAVKLDHTYGFSVSSVSRPIKDTDYTIVNKPMAVIYRDRIDQKKMMRETEVHKFSDGTLTRILEKLNHMVKDFKLYEYNSGIETRIWSEDDRRKSKNFMEVIERRLKIKRIFKSLESFVSGRPRDYDYRLIQRTE